MATGTARRGPSARPNTPSTTGPPLQLLRQAQTGRAKKWERAAADCSDVEGGGGYSIRGRLLPLAAGGCRAAPLAPPPPAPDECATAELDVR